MQNVTTIWSHHLLEELNLENRIHLPAIPIIKFCGSNTRKIFYQPMPLPQDILKKYCSLIISNCLILRNIVVMDIIIRDTILLVQYLH